MRKLLLTLLVACVGYTLPYAQTPTILEPGQIGLVGFVSDDKPNDDLNQSSFAFILLTDVNPGTEIHFTDMGWNNRANRGSGAFTTDEQILTWVATDTVAAGTIVIIQADTAAAYQPVGARIVHGPGTLEGEMLQLSHVGDQIFIFQGPPDGMGDIVLLGGLSINRRWGDKATPNQEHKSDLPSELVVDTTGTDTGGIVEPVPFVLDFPIGNAEGGSSRVASPGQPPR